jgi:hypothetical protein
VQVFGIVHGEWLSVAQFELNDATLQPVSGDDMAAAGDERLSRITGAVHAAPPATALALIRSRRLNPLRDSPETSDTEIPWLSGPLPSVRHGE